MLEKKKKKKIHVGRKKNEIFVGDPWYPYNIAGHGYFNIKIRSDPSDFHDIYIYRESCSSECREKYVQLSHRVYL